MEELKVGLCDDEEHVHSFVHAMLQKYCEEKNMSLCFYQYLSAKKLLESNDELDFLLLDIEMPEMDGIDAGYHLMKRKIDYKIIMLTGREDRYKEAFEIGVFRFVSKPIDQKEFFKAIDAVCQIRKRHQKVEVFYNGRAYWIAQKAIFYIQANHSETLIFTDSLVFRSEKAIAKWKEELDENAFFQCHKSYIVNLEHIHEFGNNVILLKSGEKVAVSRRLKNQCIDAFITFDTKWR